VRRKLIDDDDDGDDDKKKKKLFRLFSYLSWQSLSVWVVWRQLKSFFFFSFAPLSTSINAMP